MIHIPRIETSSKQCHTCLSRSYRSLQQSAALSSLGISAEDLSCDLEGVYQYLWPLPMTYPQSLSPKCLHCQLSPGSNPSAAEDPWNRARILWLTSYLFYSTIVQVSQFLWAYSSPNKLEKAMVRSLHKGNEQICVFSIHHSIVLAVVTSLSSSIQSIITRRKFSFKTYLYSPCTLPSFLSVSSLSKPQIFFSFFFLFASE